MVKYVFKNADLYCLNQLNSILSKFQIVSWSIFIEVQTTCHKIVMTIVSQNAWTIREHRHFINAVTDGQTAAFTARWCHCNRDSFTLLLSLLLSSLTRSETNKNSCPFLIPPFRCAAIPEEVNEWCQTRNAILVLTWLMVMLLLKMAIPMRLQFKRAIKKGEFVGSVANHNHTCRYSDSR